MFKINSSCRRRPASSTLETLDSGMRRNDDRGIRQGLLKNSARFLFLALAITWAGVIFYLSSQPGIDTPLLFPGQDKLCHMVAFGVLGVFLMGGMKATSSGYRTGQVWFAVVLVTLYGLFDEFHQYFVPGRTVDIYDALADAAGGLLGAWSMFYLAGILTRQNPSAK